MKRQSVLAYVALIVSGAALAQSGSGPTTFSELDVDSDERISVSEAEANMAVLEKFNDADVSRDGYLTREEFAAIAEGSE